jgi:hypothetical protein
MTSIICMNKIERRMQIRLRNSQVSYNADYVLQHRGENLKVVGNQKVGGSGMCQTVQIWLGPQGSRFVSLSVLSSCLILSISVSALVKQTE